MTQRDTMSPDIPRFALCQKQNTIEILVYTGSIFCMLRESQCCKGLTSEADATARLGMSILSMASGETYSGSAANTLSV